MYEMIQNHITTSSVLTSTARPKVAPPAVTPSQWAAQRAQAMERLQASPAQWAAARQRALDTGISQVSGDLMVI